MGDQKEPLAQDGSSVYPGNINALVFDCERYQQVLERCEGRIVEFVNPKYKAQSNQTGSLLLSRVNSVSECVE